MNKISASIGILTYNSEKTLKSCLESVKDFGEIIIADGGSTDGTLEIAKQYGAKIISQSNPGHPITDFAKERQRVLDVAGFEWFFYLDSDETMTLELRDEIRMIVERNTNEYLVYKVRYQLSSPDFSRRYESYKPYYQTRFFNKKSGAYFVRPIHERISFDEKKYRVGIIKSPWLVPLHEDDLIFREYRKKVHYRIGVMASHWSPRNIYTYVRFVLLDTFINIFKYMYKIIALRIRYKTNQIVPLRYEFYRLYSQFFTLYIYTKVFFFGPPPVELKN